MLTATDLKPFLQKRYDREAWQPRLQELFGQSRTEFFAQPQSVANPAPDRVAAVRQLGFADVGEVGLFGANQRLAIVEVELRPATTQIGQNRVGLRSLTYPFIDGVNTHGLLVFYHDPAQPDYRFSLQTHGAAGSASAAERRRHTFVLGPREAATTAAQRLSGLATKSEQHTLTDIQEAFSVEKLNKEFFKHYKAHYEKFYLYLALHHREEFLPGVPVPEKAVEKEKQEKPIRNFAKKLLGRLVFLHFLQRKGWLGCSVGSEKWQHGSQSFLLDLFGSCPDKARFHSQVLSELFFRTLNNPDRPQHRFQVAGMAQPCRVPYLNGGLFDNDEPHIVNLDFPAEFFKDLLEFFAQYNFTIDENRPNDHEVGIDPEMLGHIFENLLEENREKGAFYTPREIVQYMCQEALTEHLSRRLASQGVTRAEVVELVQRQQVAPGLRPHAKRADELLRDITVCDPAIGSGAFPMGMLQEIFTARRFLFPHLAPGLTFDPVQVKKHIIQHTIHGVDLERGAVDIARLRFWLALVVDEDSPQPLPNLDYKIMQGNSLLESFEGIPLHNIKPAHQAVAVHEPQTLVDSGQQLGMFQKSVAQQTRLNLQQAARQQQQQEAIDTLLAEYFAVGDAPRKRELRQQIDARVHEHLAYNVEAQLIQAQRLLYEAQAAFDIIRLDPKDTAAKRQQKDKARAKQQKTLDQCQQKVTKLEGTTKRLDTLQDSAERPYFLWHLYFKDVFDSGGFDVMIGNPPYISLSKIKEEASQYATEGYQTFEKAGDIYCLFHELALKKLRPDGVLAYITSNSWLQTIYGKSLRHLLTKEADPIALLNFADTQLFETATVETNILLARRTTYQNALQAVTVGKDYQRGTSLASYAAQHGFKLAHLPEEGWSVGNAEAERLKKAMETVGTRLDEWPISIYRGVTTGYNPAFVIDDTTRLRLIQQDPRSADIIKPTLQGKDLKPYHSKQEKWLINSHNGLRAAGIPPVDVKRDYPAVYHYLSTFLPKIEVRADQGNHWTNLRSCAFLLDFEKPKLVWGELSDTAKFSFDADAHYAEASTFIMVGQHLKYLLAVLNSHVASWYFDQITTTSGVGTTRWKKYKIQQLPVPEPSAVNSKHIEQLIDSVQEKKRNGNNTSEEEAEIDALVLSAYGFSSIESEYILSAQNVSTEQKKMIVRHLDRE